VRVRGQHANASVNLPPREDRNLDAPLFPGLTDANLRMAITRACKAAGVPHFSPHALRRRRGCLHYKRTGSLAEVADFLGDTKNVAAEHYIYALTDYREIDPQPGAHPTVHLSEFYAEVGLHGKGRCEPGGRRGREARELG
jgi:integrase